MGKHSQALQVLTRNRLPTVFLMVFYRPVIEYHEPNRQKPVIPYCPNRQRIRFIRLLG